jgi:cyclophilin family peptidyl-prolyl cis-trans isomerase
MNLLEYIKNPITSNQLLDVVQMSVADNEQILTKIQTGQWSDGKDKEGKIIGRYKPFTESKSKESPFPNKPKTAGQPYNLDWSGDLIRRTFVKTKRISGDVLVQVDSTGENLLELFDTIENYGLIDNPNTIFGYEPKKMDVVVKLLNRDTLTKLKRRLK